MSVVEISSFFTTSPNGWSAGRGGAAAGEINTKANSAQLNWGWGGAWQYNLSFQKLEMWRICFDIYTFYHNRYAFLININKFSEE